MARCLYCGKAEVDNKRWNRPCAKCVKNRAQDNKIRVMQGSKQVSAIIEDSNGHKLYVDKFGVPVDKHSYDLVNDPRGYKASGKIGEKLQII